MISLVLLTALHFLQTRAKGVGGGGRAIAKLMLVMGMLLEVVAGGTSNGFRGPRAGPACRVGAVLGRRRRAELD